MVVGARRRSLAAGRAAELFAVPHPVNRSIADRAKELGGLAETAAIFVGQRQAGILRIHVRDCYPIAVSDHTMLVSAVNDEVVVASAGSDMLVIFMHDGRAGACRDREQRKEKSSSHAAIVRPS